MRALAIWNAKWWILLAAIAAAGIAIGVSALIPPTYQASATIRVAAQAGQGNAQDAVQASNDLAGQYAQLVNSSPIIKAASARANVAPSALVSSISAGTVADQNLIKIDANARNPAVAVRRANAVASAAAVYIRKVNESQAGSYGQSVRRLLAPIDRDIAKARREVDAADTRSRGHSSSAAVASRQAVLASLLAQRQQVLASVAQSTAGSQPSVQVFARADAGSKTWPKPVLYAVVAFVVVALAAAQIAAFAARRRTWH